MKWKFRLLCSLASLLAVSLFTACNSNPWAEDQNEQQVPWSQPASWEGQVPGMPTTQG